MVLPSRKQFKKGGHQNLDKKEVSKPKNERVAHVAKSGCQNLSLESIIYVKLAVANIIHNPLILFIKLVNQFPHPKLEL